MEHTMEHSIWVYLGLTLILGGSAGYVMGRSFAQSWKPAWQLLLAGPALALGVRFLFDLVESACDAGTEPLGLHNSFLPTTFSPSTSSPSEA